MFKCVLLGSSSSANSPSESAIRHMVIQVPCRSLRLQGAMTCTQESLPTSGMQDIMG